MNYVRVDGWQAVRQRREQDEEAQRLEDRKVKQAARAATRSASRSPRDRGDSFLGYD